MWRLCEICRWHKVVPTRVLIPKACEIYHLRAQSAVKCGEQLPTKCSSSNFYLVLNALETDKQKIDHILKPENRIKKIYCAKMVVRYIPIFPANFANFGEFYFAHLVGTFWTLLTQKRNMIFQHIAYLLCKDDHFWGGGGGVCISLVGTQPIDHISRTKNRTKKIIVRSIRFFPVNLANVEENLIFCVSFWTIRTPIPNSKTEKSWDMIFLSFQP